jgi:hypothetical protein
MIPDSEGSEGELKRVDHLMYVTLKYTRTVDVMKNIIAKLISAMDHAIIDSLTYYQTKERIKDIPATPISRAELFKKTVRCKEREKFLEYIELYFFLKMVDKAEFTKKSEFRKDVTLTVMQDDEVFEIKTPDLMTYFDKVKDFVRLVEEYCKND